MLLDGVRVLDLTDHRGEIGPWLLASLGAEVIKVEPPGGSPARAQHPWHDGQSLQFAAYNDNKASIVLDLGGSATDRATFVDLVAGAEIVFDSGPPGAVAAAGIGEATLIDANPDLVYVLVSGFGADGPRADQPCSELTLAALGGPMSIQGVRERAPVKVSIPQAWRHAGAEAAVAAMIGLQRAQQQGGPQFIDVSAQAAMTWTMLNAMEADEVQGFDFQRAGATLKLAVEIPLRRMAKDGYVVAAPAGIGMGPLIPWLMAEGIAPPAWQDEDWATFDHRFLSGVATVATYDDLTAALDELCARHTREELMLGGLEVGSTIAPINTIVDLLGIDHLHTRGFWAPWGDAGATVRPGSPVTVDGQRLGQPGRVPDPDADGPALRAAPRRPRRAAPPQAQRATGDLPFSGIKVADFSWIGVGPITTKALADHGATVVRIESERRLDTLRAQAPFKDAVFGINRSNFYGSFNTSKWSLSVDLAKPEGLDIARRMTAWADVVLDSFRPGTMAKLGLSHDEIAASNPSVITVTTSLLGSGGPLSALAGYGFHAGAIAGFTDLVGWPDLGPDGPWMAYTDTIAPRILTTAVLAALDRRSRTGEGCHIECAQLEAGLHFLAPELLDYQLSGRVPTRLGNRDPHLAPQGAYPCAGEDEWCALTVADDAAWKALRSVLGDPEWASAPALATAAGRLAHHDDIDAHLAAWTRRQDAAEVERQLRAAGVPAGKVQRSCDLRTDPQYTHYGFYRRLEHAEVGIVPYSGHQYRIRGYDHGPRFAAPMLGQHTNEVLVDLLAMSDDDVTAAAIADALA